MLMVAGISSLSSCRKDDNPKLPELTRVPVPLLELDPSSTLIIEDNAEKSTFTSSFDVKLYYPDDVKPQKYSVVVAKNGDYTDVKTYQADLTAFPSTIEVTTQKLAETFGMTMAQLIPGTFFEMRVSFTLQDGTVIPGFNPGGEAYGTDLGNLPGSNLTLKYQIVCALDLNTFLGTMTAEDAFWGETYPVTVTLAGPGKLRVTDFLGIPGNTFVIDVNTTARTISVPKQVYAAQVVGYPYTNWAIAGNGEIDACNTEIVINGTFTVDQGGFGSYKVVLSK